LRNSTGAKAGVITCTSCAAENEPGRKFCLNCGQRLAVTCPACGSANTAGAKFCGECGNALAEDQLAVPAAAGSSSPATERRLVSVLFADLVGFTTLSESRDAEDVRALLDAYFETCRAIVNRYGGTVEKFIGDAVMAVWGTPTAQEDDAERAVRAALDLVDAVRRMGSEREMRELALRAAVHSGEAVVTLGASGMGMVAGDLVNTASRLQSVAPPGTVLVGGGTQRAASNAIVFEPAGEQELKGKAAPVPAFQALRVVAQRGGVGRTEALEPPFVGRDSELQLIKDFYHATARDRGPRLVSVMGQAGIGKSRLAWEFLKYIDGVTEVAYWHQGRSPAYGEGISFWALGEMVRMRIGVGEGADEAATRERLATSLNEFVTDADERRSLEDPLLHLLGIGENRSRERGQLFIAWRTFFERIAEAGPVIMVFEDLQWADEGLLDFIEELLSWSRGHSIYIITLSRPELLDRRTTWGAGQRSFTSLSLAPLDDDEMATMLRGLVPGLPESVIDHIVRRAEGIPLYAVETVRTLLNDGRIERDGDSFRPVGDLRELAVPESLQALIAARIDGLPAAERTLVQDASVLGLSFGAAALGAITRANPDGIDGMLHHLSQREILVRDDDPRSPERGQYRFVQGLLREVAYATLSRDDRRARHVAAARYYEALGDDELAGVLAQHYVDAYEAHPSGPEGAAVAAQARVALRAAAQRALELGSARRAHSYLAAALTMPAEPAEELELLVAASEAALDAGMFDTAVERCERVIQRAAEVGDDATRRRGIARLANVLLEGQQERALGVLEAAMAEPGLVPEDPGYLELATALAKGEMRRMNADRSVELSERVLPLAAAAGNDAVVLDLLITRGVSLSGQQRTLEAITILTGALEVARRHELPDAITRAATNLGFVLAPDDSAAAYAVSRQGLEEATRFGIVWAIRYLLGNAVDGAIDVGDWDWALEAMADREFLLVEPAERLWFGVYGTFIREFRGEDTGQLAQELFESSRDIDDHQFRVLGGWALAAYNLVRDRHADQVGLIDSLIAVGPSGAETAPFGVRSAIWHGDLPTARRMRDAFTVAQGGRRNGAFLTTMDAGIAALEGRAGDAASLYREAERAFGELGLPIWLALVKMDRLATHSVSPSDRARVADEARQILAGLRAQGLIDRLDAILAAGPPPSSALPATDATRAVEARPSA
jgi:class 3 adenylate cyclase/tetratricopeptide (TPR) repeat protein